MRYGKRRNSMNATNKGRFIKWKHANLFKNAIVYADDKEQCIRSGELQSAYKENIGNDIDGEIGELILNNKRGRTLNEEITIFDSTGLFIQDLATSIELLEKSNELNIGTEVEI